MKTHCRPLRAAICATCAILLASSVVSPAQLLSETAESDSFVAVVADAQGLPLVPRDQLPWFGSFWVVRNSVPCVTPPLPCPPLDESLPVYAISEGQFLVDEAGGPLLLRRSSTTSLTSADYAAIIQTQVDDLVNHIAFIQEAESKAGLSTLDSEDPPPVPGEGAAGDNRTNSPPIYTLGLDLCLYPPVITSNSITIAITNTPDSGWLTNAYDLFYTTNMASLPEPVLCVTNWAWWSRSTSGQTNFAISNPGFSECYFRLGTMQDSDADGLTDAYERLTSHTDPENPDTDGDGLSDGYEVWGSLTNPRVAAAVPALTGCPIPACPIP